MLPFSAAAENNKKPILQILKPAFAECRAVLEIGSGTGQHAVHFAAAMPHLTWQPSDLLEHFAALDQRVVESDLENIRSPMELDVTDLPWPVPTADDPDAYDGIFSANVLQIVPWEGVESFFDGVAETLAPGGVLCVYGPFKYEGAFTTPSNEAFDKSLKEKNPASGIRDFEAVNALASAAGLKLVADHAMPANNQLLHWVRA